MHILYLHQHFALPSGSSGTRSYEFARRWVKAGCKVTILCGRFDMAGLLEQSDFVTEGIKVKVVGSVYSQHQSFLRRIWTFFEFMITATLFGLGQKPDIIFATSTPLTIGIPAMLIRWFKRVPYVFEVRDQWPEIPIEMGIIKSPVIKKLLLWIEKRIYCKASAIVALSPGMAAGIRSVLDNLDKQILVAPNSADLELFRPDISSGTIREKMGWHNKFIIMHFGAMGTVNSLEYLVEVACKLSSYKDILFVLIGGGKEKNKLEEQIKQNKLNNIEIHGSVPKCDLPCFVAACDVSTVIIGKYPILEHNSANKFFDSLAAGKPVLLNYSGWQREVIERHQAGFGCRQYDIEEYVEKVKLLVSLHRDQLLQMSQNARRLAEAEFSRDKLAADVLKLLTANA
jgi:glycosyltransferase involved in cell wall biosynthesis